MNGDLFPITSRNRRGTERFSVGLNGAFDLFGSNWTFELYGQRGETDVRQDARTTNSASFAMALDAVRDPATGQIVCRSTLTDPNNGCKPYNPMGVGVNSEATIDYLYRGIPDSVIGPNRNEELTQEVYAISFAGSPFSMPAGDVGIAFGFEHRSEEISGTSDIVSQTTRWFNGNYLPVFGKYDVNEAFLEFGVPIIEDMLELSGAVRATDYSTSGNVTTWKVGATFSPVGDLRLRATVSRDIRAPNLGELFQAGGAQTNSVTDPFNNNALTQFLGIVSGNPGLTPEEADTFAVGFIYEPRFIEGLRMSVDYYDIEISDAIGSVGVQAIVDQCFAGIQTFCDAITRGIGPTGILEIQEVRRSPFNFVTIQADGIDFAANYVTEGFGGDWNFDLTGTHYLTEETDNGINPVFNSVGSNLFGNPPDWIVRASATYNRDAITTTLTARGISDGVHDNRDIVCTSGCPTSTSDNRTVNSGKIAGVVTFDWSAAYRFEAQGADAEFYFTIRNLLNKEPPRTWNGPGGVSHQLIATNYFLYDLLGTVFRVGLRVEF